MRHTTNHKGTAEDCVVCRIEEEIDKRKKMELKVMKIATSVPYSETGSRGRTIYTKEAPQKTRA